ncbi:hypothetical protein Athai_45060 [Actinocatenispora thailandica]|uniref:Uncharacterized protein n=1 Tax=Actinocatenispora thailandica TaxID=227318 RepID=A0A7R7DSH8_9ACTN|nr:hypothetical protein Athai_45060 [Actinocatenispora thailandica]
MAGPASQADLARLRAPYDPATGRYRAPEEKDGPGAAGPAGPGGVDSGAVGISVRPDACRRVQCVLTVEGSVEVGAGLPGPAS